MGDFSDIRGRCPPCSPDRPHAYSLSVTGRFWMNTTAARLIYCRHQRQHTVPKLCRVKKLITTVLYTRMLHDLENQQERVIGRWEATAAWSEQDKHSPLFSCHKIQRTLITLLRVVMVSNWWGQSSVSGLFSFRLTKFITEDGGSMSQGIRVWFKSNLFEISWSLLTGPSISSMLCSTF